MDQNSTPDQIIVIPEVAALLAEELEVDNLTALMKQLARIEAWQGRVAFQYRNAERFLFQVRRQMLIPVQRGVVTDMDRTISLESSTAEQQCTVDILKDYSEALQKKLSLGQSIMASQRQEMKAQIR